VALVLISFLPLVEIMHLPIVGMVSLAIILTTLVARVPFPGRIPGALAGLLVGSAVYYVMQWGGMLEPEASQGVDPRQALLPFEWLTVFHFQWVHALRDALHYLPIVIPFALATVVGGIDCTESAAAAGDEYETGKVIAVEAFATLVGSLCGGVIQSTPYIGHPAYKAMGGRAAYALATALFVGSAGLLGYFGYLYAIVPKVTVFPILVFVGLEITAQSFQATPRRHYAALAFACVPLLAALTLIPLDNLTGEVARRGIQVSSLSNSCNRNCTRCGSWPPVSSSRVSCGPRRLPRSSIGGSVWRRPISPSRACSPSLESSIRPCREARCSCHGISTCPCVPRPTATAADISLWPSFWACGRFGDTSPARSTRPLRRI